MERFLLVTDTPGIKQFVFTDALAEVRGASALLDHLNRAETVNLLRDNLPAGARLDRVVYVNGGTGQFVLTAEDDQPILAALEALAAHYHKETGGEVHIAWGLTRWPDSRCYQHAARAAYSQLRVLRETASGRAAATLLPFLMECASTSHLPALDEPTHWGGERLFLSDAAQRKRDQARKAGRAGVWPEWMEHLKKGGSWPDDPKVWAEALRYGEIEELDRAALRRNETRRRGYVGLVYCDGNAMGRLVQELDREDTCHAFSTIVDGSIREACYEALDAVCAEEIAATRAAYRAGQKLGPLPADILLLGGDDLLVFVPADRALPFALHATEAFERRTREEVARLLAGKARRFFEERLSGRGMTVSCGVALAPVKYPFYLLYELAEELLKSAKKGGSADAESRAHKHWAPASVDFHLVAGAASDDLGIARRDDYHTKTEYKRTLRPYRRDRLEQLRAAVLRLQQARLPRSKLQDLADAALDPLPLRAERRARELFGRLKKAERLSLWLALADLRAAEHFPWCSDKDSGGWQTALADLAEAHDLFPRAENP